LAYFFSFSLLLEGMDLEDAADHPEVWEKAIRKLRGRLMPPPGSPQPEQAAIDSFVGWLEKPRKIEDGFSLERRQRGGS
jgi:hypothetical protein